MIEQIPFEVVDEDFSPVEHLLSSGFFVFLQGEEWGELQELLIKYLPAFECALHNKVLSIINKQYCM